MMKTKNALALVSVCSVLALSVGCGKNDGAAPPTANTTPMPASPAAAPSQPGADAAKAAETAKTGAMTQQAAAEKAAADKLGQVAVAAAQEQARIQGLIDSAKSLAGQNKYADALKILGDLANLKLSPEQQAMVDGLKKSVEQQAAKAATDKAAASGTKALGDALGGKK